jgi:hypothetical protein
VSLTVRELREALAGLPDDMLVVMSRDAEGNGYSPLVEASESMYLAETTWSGDLYPTPEDIAADAQLGEDDEAPDDAVRVIALWPVN